MNVIIVNLYLLWGSIQDLRKKKIGNAYLWIGGIIGIVFKIAEYGEEAGNLEKWIVSFFPGAVLLVLAKVTKEKIGLGDGWVVIVLGNFMTVSIIIVLLQNAIILAALFSMFFLCIGRVSKDYHIPFLPFLWLSHIFLWRLGYV